jgi:tetratricopeptide (TPR) repeat protein
LASRNPITRRRITQLAVLAVIIILSWFYNEYYASRRIVAPSEWDRESADGVRAMERGSLEDAERFFVSAQKQSEKFAADDSRRGTSLHNLADLRRAQRRYHEAGDLYARALSLLEQSSNPPEREIGVLLGGYAIACAADHDLERSEQLLRRAITINERVRGPGDEEVASNLSNLAGVLVAQNRISEGAQYAMRASGIRNKRQNPAPATSP